VLHVSLKTDTLHLLMCALGHYEQGLALCTVCSVRVCVLSGSVVTTQHGPVWHYVLCAVSYQAVW
jgi:hypothetical protein